MHLLRLSPPILGRDKTKHSLTNPLDSPFAEEAPCVGNGLLDGKLLRRKAAIRQVQGRQRGGEWRTGAYRKVFSVCVKRDKRERVITHWKKVANVARDGLIRSKNLWNPWGPDSAYQALDFVSTQRHTLWDIVNRYSQGGNREGCQHREDGLDLHDCISFFGDRLVRSRMDANPSLEFLSQMGQKWQDESTFI